MKRHLAIAAILFCVNSLYAVPVVAKLPPMNISDGEVSPGQWNSNVDEVLQKAKEMHRPALIVYAKRGCPNCYRLLASMTNEMFVAWQRESKLLMGIYHRNRPSIRIGNANIADEKTQPSVMKEISRSGVTAPAVYVYWPKENGEEIKRIFSGTRGKMLGQKHEKLEGELIMAVDSIVRPPEKNISSTKQQ